MTEAEKMFAGDRVLSGLGAKLLSSGDGQAQVSIAISEEMVQAFGTCHGGIIYTLADATFGVACNSGNDTNVAQFCSISYLKPVAVGDELSVCVQRRSTVGRTGVYDGTVFANGDTPVAEFRGNSRALPLK